MLASACCARDACHPHRARRHLPSFPRSMSLGAPSPVRRDASRALWRSFQHSAAPGLHLPASSCWHPLQAWLCPECNTLDTLYIFFSSKNGPYIRIRLVTPRDKNKHTGSTTPTDAFAPASTSGRPRGGRAQAGLPFSTPMPTHPRRDPGPKRPRAARPQTPH